MLSTNWLDISQNIFIFFACLIALFLQSLFLLERIICAKQFKTKLSQTLLTNVACWCLACVGGIWHSVYFLWLEFGGTNLLSGPLVFYSGSAYFVGTSVVSVSVAFMMLERIKVLVWPTQKWSLFGNSVNWTTILIASLFVTISLMLSELPVDEFTLCTSWRCITHRHRGLSCNFTKTFFGLVNFLLALVFFIFIYRRRNQLFSKQKQYKQANFISILAAVTEFLFNLAPNLFYIINHLRDLPQWEVYGPYIATLCAFDAISTALIYRLLLVRKSNSQHGIRLFRDTRAKICQSSAVGQSSNR